MSRFATAARSAMAILAAILACVIVVAVKRFPNKAGRRGYAAMPIVNAACRSLGDDELSQALKPTQKVDRRISPRTDDRQSWRLALPLASMRGPVPRANLALARTGIRANSAFAWPGNRPSFGTRNDLCPDPVCTLATRGAALPAHLVAGLPGAPSLRSAWPPRHPPGAGPDHSSPSACSSCRMNRDKAHALR